MSSLSVSQVLSRRYYFLSIGHYLRKYQETFRDKNMSFQSNRYHNFFEHIKEGVLILNANNGIIIDANPYLVNMLACSKEQLLFKDIREISNFDTNEPHHFFAEISEKEHVYYPSIDLKSFNNKPVRVEFVGNKFSVDHENIIQCNLKELDQKEILFNEFENTKNALKELQHRAKNSFSIISGLIKLSTNLNISNESKTLLEDLYLKVHSISVLYTLLFENNSCQEVNIKKYCDKIFEHIGNLNKDILFNTEIEDISIPVHQASILGLILVELLSNSIKYAFTETNEGIVNVKFGTAGLLFVLKLEDNGKGFPDDFIFNKSNGIGLHIVHNLVKQLDGTLDFVSGGGAKFIIQFPI